VAILTWGAPGDDGYTGTATAYELRYSSSPITEQNFESGVLVAYGPPKPVGEIEACLITGLFPCTTYWFGLKTRDEWGNWSGLALASGTTMCSGAPLAAGLEAETRGTDVHSQMAGPTASVASSPSGLYWLGRGPAAGSLGASITITQVGTGATAIDSVGALAVDHGPETVVWTSGNQLMEGQKQAAARVTSSRGGDVTAQLGAGGYVVQPSETLSVRLAPSPAAEAKVFAIETGPKPQGTDATPEAIAIEELDTSGLWRLRDQFTPGYTGGAWVSEVVTGDSLRLVFHEPCPVRFMGRAITSTMGPTADHLQLVQAEHSRLGDIREGLAAGVPLATLLPGDRLALGFAGSSMLEGKVRDQFLMTGVTSITTSPDLEAAPSALLPLKFALRQNRPNPFAIWTAIHFDLPVAAPVQLEVFDIQGRRIRVLAQGTYPAGFHAVDWDKRTSGGTMVRPGVYLYRINAGSFQAKKKMVLLP